ncbi:MAG: hypothetical protein KDM63_20345, partial [Verrucomicrobiae bacterium]|nr:hypothetical protein [Verrucomicrobiae bacterium]
KKGIEQANVGAVFPIPSAFVFILQWITPAMLLIIFLKWLLWDVIGIGGQPSGYITDLAGEKSNQIAQLSVGLILLVAVMITLILSRAAIYKNELRSGGDADAE